MNPFQFGFAEVVRELDWVGECLDHVHADSQEEVGLFHVVERQRRFTENNLVGFANCRVRINFELRQPFDAAFLTEAVNQFAERAGGATGQERVRAGFAECAFDSGDRFFPTDVLAAQHRRYEASGMIEPRERRLAAHAERGNAFVLDRVAVAHLDNHRATSRTLGADAVHQFCLARQRVARQNRRNKVRQSGAVAARRQRRTRSGTDNFEEVASVHL